MSKQKGIHWYDGWFYEKFIAKHTDSFSDILFSLIDENKSVLDVGCGTGRMTLQLAGKCKSITGIDLSAENIAIAKSKLTEDKTNNVKFILGDVIELLDEKIQKYDYTILSFVIHEIPLDLRGNVITALKKVSERIIFADYDFPEVKGAVGILNRIVEFMAGREHYKGYKSYIANGGLKKIIAENNLKVEKEIKETGATHHILLTRVQQ